jgi:beta-1,4-N-acetylglucosaminyltransferase
MEALRYECPLIIVPNPTLLNNHQAEIASHVAAKDLAVVGQLGHLHEALHASRLQAAKRNLDSLPPYRDPPFPVPETDRRKLLDWTLLTCYPDELARRMEKMDAPRMSHGSVDTDIDSLDAYDREIALGCLQRG